jgi:hypothetical protein
MKEILDDNFAQAENESKEKEIKKFKTKAVLYIFIMFIGGMVYYYLTLETTMRWYQVPILSINLIFACIILSLFSEFVQYIFRRIKNKPNKDTDPFLFRLIEGGFAFWIILIPITFIGNYLT